MRVVFRKTKRDLCHWEAYPPGRRPVTAVGGPTGHGLPHDLGQFVVERERGYRYGFWGCLADGATFRRLQWGGRRRTPQGRAVIAAHAAELDAAEREADAHTKAWRDGRTTALTPVLDEMRARWLALPEGGALELEFPLAPSSGRGGRRRPSRR